MFCNLIPSQSNAEGRSDQQVSKQADDDDNSHSGYALRPYEPSLIVA